MAEEKKELQLQEAQKQEVVESGAERTRPRPAFIPRADIYELNDEIVVVADMPGVDTDSVEVTLERDTLTINGYVKPLELPGYTLAYAEYREGDYQRRFSVTDEIDQDRIEAKMKDGVLYLHLPKAVPAARRIAVKAG